MDSTTLVNESCIYGNNFRMGRFGHIGKGVSIGNDVVIGDYCKIMDGVNIGDNTTICDYSCIGNNSRIGRNCCIGFYTSIGNNVVIGNGFKTNKYCEIRDNCLIGNSVNMGSRCTLSAGTIVMDNVIMKYDFVATDTPILGKKNRNTCILESGSRFGASVVIMPGVIIGENSEIGTCSQVRCNVPPNEVWYGNPAKVFIR